MKKNNVFSLGTVMWMIFLFAAQAQAQPSLQEMLGETLIVDKEECATVTVSFNLRVRYIKHFPYNSGEELRIHLEPIALTPSERESITQNESILPPESEIAAIDQIVYEGGVNGDQFLTIFFKHAVTYTVQQGSDFRSIVVTVFLPSATAPCSH
jgi:hypothetical protein